jgi:hypothetical protein
MYKTTCKTKRNDEYKSFNWYDSWQNILTNRNYMHNLNSLRGGFGLYLVNVLITLG